MPLVSSSVGIDSVPPAVLVTLNDCMRVPFSPVMFTTALLIPCLYLMLSGCPAFTGLGYAACDGSLLAGCNLAPAFPLSYLKI